MLLLRDYSLINRIVTAERLLKYTREEANDRIFFHIDHVIKVGRYYSVASASPNTNIFVAPTYHINKLKYFNLEFQCKLWFVKGRSFSRTVFQMYVLADDLDPDIVDVLPRITFLLDMIQPVKLLQKVRPIKSEHIMVTNGC